MQLCKLMMQFVTLNLTCWCSRFYECALHRLIAVNEKLSWFVHCFVVTVPRLVNLDADDWRRGLRRRLHREDDSGNDRDGVSFHPFPQAAAENPINGQQCQPDKHQVEINTVAFNQAVQSVENGIQ